MSGPAPVRSVIDGILYGPVKSRRFGISLGINLSGRGKYCSFSCPYCFRGANHGRPDHPRFRQGLPTPGAVLRALEERLRHADGEGIRDWTIAGNAEPTDHPDFPAIVRRLIAMRDRSHPGVKISVLTNGMGLTPRLNANHEAVRLALEAVDRPCLKLDGGTPATWRKLANPYAGVTLPEWMEGARRLSRPIIQTMLVRGRIDNTTPDEVAALKARYREIAPRGVQILTINKPPADSRLHPAPPGLLEQLRGVLAF
ncbi:MAG: radical SAM protein [Desulfobacterales bacterium]|nr:radical SAM protein [Desulfobacterales bacterium]